MKRAFAWLFAMLGCLASAAEARADVKQECAAAYDKTQTLRDQGQLVAARAQALACSASTCPGFVVKDCAQWLAEIDAAMPTIVLTAEDAAGADTLAVRVMVDGILFRERLDGKAAPLDPGEHVIRFEIAGATPIEQRIVVRQGEKNRRVGASFRKQPPSSTSGTYAATPDAPARARVPVWAWISGGLGVALLGVGAGFGVSALRAQSELGTLCGDDLAHCPASKEAQGRPLANQRTLGRNAFIGLAAGGVVGIVVGIVGIATASPPKAPTRSAVSFMPYASPLGSGFAVTGRF
jgi:hypothetical protein